MTQILYAGTDITKEIDIKKCLLCDNAGGSADDASIVFPDSEKIWGKWNPQKGDSLIVKTDGYSTGTVFVDSVSQSAGIFTLNAISTPLSAKRPKTRIWRDVKLSEIISDIAAGNGLAVNTYGLKDYTYKAVAQTNQADIDFLNKVCLREGYCCKASDRKLVVFDERTMEAMTATVELTPDYVCPEYSFEISDNVVASFKVLHSPYGKELLTYTATDPTITGGAGRKIEFLSNVGEAERWSKGYLRSINKYRITAWLPMKSMTGIAAGSVVNVKGFGAFDGKYYVYRVSQDTVTNKSFLYIRQVINTY